MKLLRECQILRNRLQECSVNFLAEEEDKFTVDSSSLSDALDLLTTSDNRIGLLLAEVFCALSFCMCQQLTLLHLGLPAIFFDHPVNYLDFCLLLFVPYICGEIFNAQIYKLKELSNEVIDAVLI